MLRDWQVEPTMAPLTQRHPRFATPLLFAARLGVVVLFASILPSIDPVRAQPPANKPQVAYINLARFNFPFDDPGDRNIVKVHLNVSVDRGKTYQQVTSARPGDKFLPFTSQGDGVYYFTTQTEDVNGKLNPPDPTRLDPMMIVVVDTKKPVITLKQVQAREGLVALEWDIRDDNFDPMTLRADFRPAGSQLGWTALGVGTKAFGSIEWNPGGTGQIEVRFQAADLAKNAAEQTLILNGGGKVAPGPGTGVGNPTPAPDNIKWVNNRNFDLGYKVNEQGPSGVSKIEIWRCSPLMDWQKVETRELDKAKPPLPIRTPGEGRYGITLIPVSGVDLAMPRPVRGDSPQLWVEVDETPPTVRIQRVEVGRGADHGLVTIYWDATDNKQLAAAPISIYYSDKAVGGEWIPIATQLPNTLSYAWPKDAKKPFQCFIKVEATDMAGNVGRDVSKESVKVDPTIPRLEITDVKVAPTITPSPPTGTPP